MSAETIPVAQYLRMSTEHQQYSLDNQADAIALYALDHGFKVVKTYNDAAKSGLRLKNRSGLKQLLKDVVEGAEFRAVLVLDVSRWGRFQDTDEAAHYEYLCKSAGVPVHYCAELFANDNSIPDSIMKALKRSMAGEYSRELSGKVRAGLARLTRLGYKAGGTPSYGLRRMLLDTSGKSKQLLTNGQRKSLVTEHVTLTPGPAEEVNTVRRIFHEFAVDHRSLRGIAKGLNHDRIPYLDDAEWDASSVSRVLRHPHYAGKQVWGKTKWYLGSKPQPVPRDQWVICEKAFEPIISAELFEAAQTSLANMTCNLSNYDLIERLRTLWSMEGRLTSEIIDRSRICPGLTTYYKRFGGILPAYRLLGYPNAQRFSADANRQRAWIAREQLIDTLIKESGNQFDEVRPSKRSRTLLRHRRTGLLVSVHLARYQPNQKGEARWKVIPQKKEIHRTTILAAMDETNSAMKHLYVFRRLGRRRFTLYPDSAFLQKGVAIGHPSQLLDAIRTIRI